MTKIKLINEDGVIRGIDTETGTEVPVEFDDLATRSVETTEIDGPVSDGRTVTDLLGDGLEYASGAVRVLSRIWNGSEIVADVNSSSVVTEEQNATIKYVGPGGKYDLLSEAYADLDASESNRYVLVLTENVTEPSKLDPESHIDVHGRGFRINSQEDDQAAVHFRGVRDCTWRDVTVDLRPGDTTGAFSALRFTSDKPPNEQTLRLHNVTGIGSTGGDKSHGVRVRHSSRPIFSDCLFISGREQGSIGGHVVHGAAPDFVGCDFYAISADVASGSEAGVLVRDASTATFRNCTAYGASGNDCNAWQIEGNAAPTLQGCHGGGAKFSGFTAGPGDDSFRPTNAAGFGTMESPIGASEFNAMLESITVNIYNGVNGGTIDIGTTSGGAEIASDVDASSADRVNFDYNRVSIDPGDTWYVTTSHSSVDYGLRWTVRRTRFEASGLALSSRGPAKINGGTFLGGPKAAGAKIHPGSDRRYSINGATFVTDSDTRAAVSSSADDGVDEPIRNCTFVNTAGGEETNNIHLQTNVGGVSEAMSQTYVLPTYQMEKRSGDGSVTFTDRGIELREPGNGSATEESRAYDDVTEMDPRQPGRIRVYVSNTEFDPNGAATLRVVLSDAPDTSETADHELRCEVAGNGRCIAVCSNNGTGNKNTFTFDTDPNTLEYVDLSWADRELLATVVDSVGAHSGTVSSNYPTGETLFLSMAACDADDSTARNVGFNVEKIVLGRP